MWTRLTIAGLLAAAPAAVADAVTDLPAGEGRDLVLAYCRSCHDLGEATKFRGYFGEKEWRDVVLTMLTYELVIPGDEVETIVDYLAEALGPSGGTDE